MYTYNDGFTDKVNAKMSEFEDLIYDIEDGITSLEQSESAIIEYLKDIRCSLPLGLALRRYLCARFANPHTESSGQITFSFGQNTYTVGNFIADGYDITTDDVKEYTEICVHVCEKYNGGKLIVPKAELRRMIKSTTVCQRTKLFLLAFALNMNSDDVTKFLTDVLAEQTYNFRNPDEIIAYFCHTHKEYNSYAEYTRLRAGYLEMAQGAKEGRGAMQNYTTYATVNMKGFVNSEEDLYKFLCENCANFFGYSQTAYDEFMSLFERALEKSTRQALSNDEYLSDARFTTAEQRTERENRINNAIELHAVTNTEQLARNMLQFIPRATSTKQKADGKKIVSNDFISISNGERGQQSKKVQTTSLPKEITMNLLVKDRLDDLVRRIKPVERKDLVFLKFYLLSLDLQKKDKYSFVDYKVFMDECNDMLLRCGMSRLYPANRFENLILISLVSSNPFEMFEDIIEDSFFNEPEYTEQ